MRLGPEPKATRGFMGWREGLGELTGFGWVGERIGCIWRVFARVSDILGRKLKAQNSPRVVYIRARCRMCLESSVCTEVLIDIILY